MLEDHVGFGSLQAALAELSEKGYRRVFVVASAGGWRRFTAKGTPPLFADNAIRVFRNFSNNPDFKEILECEREYRAFAPDLVVAIGGGSAMDVAKMAKALAHTRETYDPLKPESVKPSGEGPPLVAIATTAGSGAEATQFTVFYLGEAKQSLAYPCLRPDMAVVDPELTYTLSPRETAAGGFDALCQAVESYWASASTPESRVPAEAAIRYALPNLRPAVAMPDPGNRYNMSQAAYLAGKAINSTRTTYPHALAYHLTKRYGLEHGLSCALTLPFFFRLNLDPAVKIITPAGAEGHAARMAELAALFGCARAEEAFGVWRALLRACGLPDRLAAVGMTTPDQVRTLIGTVNAARIRNHPVEVAPERLAAFFLEHDAA